MRGREPAVQWRSESRSQNSPSRALLTEQARFGFAFARPAPIAALSISLFGIVFCCPFWLAAQSHGASQPATAVAGKAIKPATGAPSEQTGAMYKLIKQLGQSGRVLLITETASDRINPAPQIAPGTAPVLIFRALDREGRYRLGRLDLVVDDAGH